ncbi:MAG: amino acid racemase [Bacillota bacterium]|nr:amino acid racemase [Bacillota bacterium]
MKKLGILGGMGPLATITLYNKIVLKTEAGNDQEHIHTIIDSNTEIPDRTSFILGNGYDPLPQLKSSIDMLNGAGADLIIMPCNTAHYFYNDLESYSKAPMLNMVKMTADISDSNTCLLATKGTFDAEIYQRYNKDIIIPDDDIVKRLMTVIYEVKSNNRIKAYEIFKKIINELRDEGYEKFILGCTELSALYDIYPDIEGEFIDPMDMMVDEILMLFGKEKATSL